MADTLKSQNKLLILGLGYVGSRLALRVRSVLPEWQVAGTARSQAPEGAHIDKLKACGIEIQGAVDPCASEYVSSEVCELLRSASHIVATAPPLKQGDHAGSDAFLPCIRHLAQQGELPNLQWVAYLSTTSVYGNKDGAWVDESTVPCPSLKRGKGRLSCEQDWLSSGLPAHVFRLPGIYGPYRGPQVKVKAGSSSSSRIVYKPNQWFSRAHVDDICSVLLASMLAPTPPLSISSDRADSREAVSQPGPPRADASLSVFNVVDDEPAPAHTVNLLACRLTGTPPPPVVPYGAVEASMSEMAKSFYGDSKRVSNRRIKLVLGIKLAFPTYREGLPACIEEEQTRRPGVASPLAGAAEVILEAAAACAAATSVPESARARGFGGGKTRAATGAGGKVLPGVGTTGSRKRSKDAAAKDVPDLRAIALDEK